MKNNVIMIFILIMIVLANVFVFTYDLNNINTIKIILVLICCTAFYKAFISDRFSNIYNIHSFKYSITSKNLLELLGSFLISLMICKSSFISNEVSIKEIFWLIVCALIIYRFLFFNLSINISSKEV
ncbi:hypothetical protein OSC52_06940 [Clostridium pasteurianum]|uniref:hypothetical protein n=1 Tax=Clostridium pasteurianum TaxID=1501 RepID=UPI002260E4E6|nr:hypothetical protein [Clostridium pasteurianum]UZW15568.1 hypothetical protein OSC52_06940 [Clostridium pasteurianum]